MRSAGTSRVGPSEQAQAWSARRNAAFSLVADCLTSVLAPAWRITIWSVSARLSTHFNASERALSNRDGLSSMACIEADASRITTRNWAGLAWVLKNGRASAKTASVNRISCRISNQFLRNR